MCTLTGSPASPKPEHVARAGQPVRLKGMVKFGFSRLIHFDTAAIFGASPGWAAVTRRSTPRVASSVRAISSRRRRCACR